VSQDVGMPSRFNLAIAARARGSRDAPVQKAQAFLTKLSDTSRYDYDSVKIQLREQKRRAGLHDPMRCHRADAGARRMDSTQCSFAPPTV
jgi:hypothetical protein